MAGKRKIIWTYGKICNKKAHYTKYGRCRMKSDDALKSKYYYDHSNGKGALYSNETRYLNPRIGERKFNNAAPMNGLRADIHAKRKANIAKHQNSGKMAKKGQKMKKYWKTGTVCDKKKHYSSKEHCVLKDSGNRPAYRRVKAANGALYINSDGYYVNPAYGQDSQNKNID